MNKNANEILLREKCITKKFVHKNRPLKTFFSPFPDTFT